MCGISGIFCFDQRFSKLSDLENMVALHVNRGPDEMGLFAGLNIGLGHSRLSIIDIQDSLQPMVSSCERYVIVYNGELFNFRQLRAELETESVIFCTNGDTEVILNSFIVWGTKCLEKFNGQFALAIYDRKNQTLFLARDRFGVRPLFYAHFNGKLFFSSSIKSILSNDFQGELNLEALNQAAHLWTTVGKSTFVKGVFSVEPGCYMFVSKNKREEHCKYWDLQFSEPDSHWSSEDASEAVREAIANSVAFQRQSDVGVNTYLSGGVDSCILQSVLTEQIGHDFKSYSIKFADQYFDESGPQQVLSEITGVRNRSILVSAKDVAKNFESTIWHVEQPIFRTAPVPMMMLSALVRSDGEKVVMSGEGADEIAWGYPIFKENLLRQWMSTGHNESSWGDVIAKLNSQLPQYNPRFKKFLLDFYKSSITDHKDPLFTHEIRVRNGSALGKYMVPGILSRESLSAAVAELLPSNFFDWSILQRTQYIEMKTLLPNYLLSSQGDRMSMANSVEARVPFLDNGLVSLFSSFPDHFKLSHQLGDKHILRRTYRKSLPADLSSRPKYPYRAPEGSAMVLDPLLTNYLNQSVVEDSGIFQWEIVKRLIDKGKKGIESWNFTENNALVFIVSTLIFQRNLSVGYDKSYRRPKSFRLVEEGSLGVVDH